MSDRFLRDLLTLDEDASEDPSAELRAHFLSFLRAGGCFTWNDWATMAPGTRQAAEAAGLEVKGDELRFSAECVAAALRGPAAGASRTAAAASAAPDDGSDARVRAALEKATTEAAASLSEGGGA